MPASIASHSVELTPGHGLYSLTASINGQEFGTHIDTGSSGRILLPEAVAKKLKTVGEPKVVGHARTPFNSFDIYSAKVEGTLKLAGLELKDPVVEYADMFPMINVGSMFLADYVIYFDQKSKRMALVHG